MANDKKKKGSIVIGFIIFDGDNKPEFKFNNPKAKTMGATPRQVARGRKGKPAAHVKTK